MSKELWILKNGEEVPPHKLPDVAPVGEAADRLVCVVSNGAFNAAAVAFSQDEYNVFREPMDFRPKTWFSVPKHKLLEVVPQPYHETL
jgi:hypothetical protein